MFNIECVENFEEFHRQVGSLFEDHYLTCEAYRAEKKDLDLNFELLQQLVDIGALKIFLLKEDEDIVGYISANLGPNPFINVLQASVDFIYVMPEFRQKGYTAKAFEKLQELLISWGVKDLNVSLPAKDYSEHVAESLGLKKTSMVYTKMLGSE